MAGDDLRLGFELVAYELARHPERHRHRDAIAALDAARAAAADLPPDGAPLRVVYEPLLALAAASLAALGALGEPDEVDGLTSLAGFEQWRRQRR